jgi:zinc protease
VTKQQVQDSAKKYLDPKKMVVVAVGDRKKIEPEMKTLGLGEAEVRDAEGKIVSGK